MKEKILKLLEEHPDLTQSDAAYLLGVSRQRIHQVCQREHIALKKGNSRWNAKTGSGNGVRSRLQPSVIAGPIGHAVGGTIAELLAAADLIARGWQVYFPLVRNTKCDLIALTRNGLKTLRIEVRSGQRIGTSLSYNKKPADVCDHYAVVLPDEPIIYLPDLPSSQE